MYTSSYWAAKQQSPTTPADKETLRIDKDGLVAQETWRPFGSEDLQDLICDHLGWLPFALGV
jgi:hypothetical protein